MSTARDTSESISVSSSRSLWERQGLVRVVSSFAIASTLVYLGWRVISTSGESVLWLFVALFVLESWTLLRLVVDVRVLWTVPETTRPELTEVLSIDIVVTTFHEPVQVVRATLLGCNAVSYPHNTLLVDDGGRAEMRELAAELGATYLHREDNVDARAGALNHAVNTSTAELLFMLEADQVPLPDALHAVAGYFHDNRVAIVQTPMEYLNRDSILHSSPNRHERSFANEVLGPARGHLGGALWEGSASLVRRVALASVGGVATNSTTGELQTTVRLHSLGWSTQYHAEPIVQGLAPHNLPAFLRQRERWARGHIGVLRTADHPLSAHGLLREQRWCFTQLLLDYIQAVVDLGYFLVLLAVLWTGVIPLNASVVSLAVFWAPAFIARSVASVALSRGRLKVGETAARRLLMFEIHLRALVTVLLGNHKRFAPVEKTGIDEGGIDVIEHLKLLTAMTLVLEIVLGFRMLDALIGWPLSSMRGLALIATALIGASILWMALQVLGVFVRRRQHRSFYRVDTDLGGYANGQLVKIRDLTPAGAGLVTTKLLAPGSRVHLRLRLPDARGGANTLDLQAVVRNQTPNQEGSRFRVGCRFVGLSGDDINQITEYASVVRPYQLLRGNSNTAGRISNVRAES